MSNKIPADPRLAQWEQELLDKIYALQDRYLIARSTWMYEPPIRDAIKVFGQELYDLGLAAGGEQAAKQVDMFCEAYDLDMTARGVTQMLRQLAAAIRAAASEAPPQP